MGKVQFKGDSLPEAFYSKVTENPANTIFATKRVGRWQPLLARDALSFVLRTMAGLERLGFQRGDVACIFSDNREEWILTDYAVQWLGGLTTAIYTTSSKSSIDYIIEQSATKFIFVSDQKLLNRLGNLENHRQLKSVIAWDPVESWDQKVPLLSRNGFIKEEIGLDRAQSLLRQISPESPSVLLYTSGTTGEPKGVLLKQKNIASNIRQMHSAFPLEELTTTMSFLPLSHIYERSLHSTLLLAGIKICFAESLDKLADNLSEVRPDVMIGVPRVFEKMYLKIQEKLESAPAWRRAMAKAAFAVGKLTIPYRLEGSSLPLVLAALNAVGDQLVLSKIRKITGGRLRFFISGGAPLSRPIAEFFFQAGITILEGYGLSETIILSVNRPDRIKFGTVGLPFEETEFRIAEDGEILVRGPQVMEGYYKRPDFTKEVFTEDGWFKTGDIGELDGDGFLSITDRKKELIVTAAGKKVAPQMIENQLKSNPLIEQVCIVGDRRKYITALIVPSLDVSRNRASEAGEKIETLSECAASKMIRAEIQKAVDEINERSGRYETIKYFTILPEAFSIESGELTPTLKLKRRVIQEKYRKVIEEMYPKEEKVPA